MSTRGVIARQNGDGFVGRYHHWDSYPSGLGKTLYDWAQRMPLDRMLRLLLDEHPAGWSTIVGKDPTMTPGFVDDYDVDRRCTICGMKVWEHYRQYYGKDGRAPLPERFAHVPKDIYLLTDHSPERETLAIDHRPSCYCHGDRHEDIDQVLTEKDATACGCEYAYVFNEEARTMSILSSYCRDGVKMIGMFGMGDPEAIWQPVAVIDLDGPEPDWKHLDSIAKARRR